MEVEIAACLNSGTIHVWKSDESEQFIEQLPIVPKKRKFTIALDPNSIYSLTTTTGQRKGIYPVPPASSFPFPYKEDFESYSSGSAPKYFADQKGTFEVTDVPGHGKCLKQIVGVPGHTWGNMISFPKPYSVIGDSSWINYSVSSDVFIVAGDVEIGGRFDGNMSKLSYRFILDKSGNWHLVYREKKLASGWINSFDASFWHRMYLSFSGDTVSAAIDGKILARVTDTSAGSGMVYIVSSYYPNMFDNGSYLPGSTE